LAQPREASPEPSSAESAPPPRGFGPPPLTPRQWRIFGLVCTAGFFENYDRALLNLALKQIQTALKISEVQLGRMLSLVRLGYVFSLIITPFADRVGRRLLIYTVIAYTVATGLSALAPSASWFVAFQVIARACTAAEAAVAIVILAEEVPANVRGWVIGLLGALTASGWGLAALVFGFIDTVPYGWRGLYAIALIPLLVIIPIRRGLPETSRFEKASEEIRTLNPLGPILELLRNHPRRLSMLLSVAFLSGMGGNSAGFFTSKYLQEAHGWTPGQVSTLIIFGGAVGILGNIIAGRMSDRLGRRTMGASFTFFAGLFSLLFYNSAGTAMAFAWIAGLFADSAATTILNAYGAELFPTSSRSTATVAVTVAGTVGGALGLFIEAVLVGFSNSHWRAISFLTAFWMISPIIMILTFPETAGRELEVTSSETATELRA